MTHHPHLAKFRVFQSSIVFKTRNDILFWPPDWATPFIFLILFTATFWFHAEKLQQTIQPRPRPQSQCELPSLVASRACLAATPRAATPRQGTPLHALSDLASMRLFMQICRWYVCQHAVGDHYLSNLRQPEITFVFCKIVQTLHLKNILNHNGIAI